jgi:Cu/Zn superoxide dismutase
MFLASALLLASAVQAKQTWGGYLASISQYPDADLDVNKCTRGSKFVIRSVDGKDSSKNLRIDYKIRNGPVGEAAGVTFHIHSGVTCEDAGRVGGHYWTPFAGPDPQNAGNGFYAYTDNKGKAQGVVFTNFGYSLSEVVGHTVVVHEMGENKASGKRIGCGVIGRDFETATADKWINFATEIDEDYTPTEAEITMPLDAAKSSVSIYANPDGTASVTYLLYAKDGVLGTSGGLHIHAGTSCDDHNDQRTPFTWGMDIAYPGRVGHYYNTESLTAAEDPWSTKWVANGSQSKAEGSFTVDTGLSFASLADKVFVVHQEDGKKAWCSKIELDDF